MTRIHAPLVAAAVALGSIATSGAAGQTTQTSPPTTAAADVMACVQAQMVVDRLLEAADARIELARQANSATEMRAAVDGLQTTVRDVRAHLAACASLPADDPHAGHGMPAKPPPAVREPPTADPHAGHAQPPTATPASPTPATAPAAARPDPKTPAATDPHAGHSTPAAPPAAPAGARPAPKPAPKPSAAPDPHAGHPEAPSRRAAPTGSEATEEIDPVCGLTVDPESAPATTHQGQTYHFCSEQHRQLFIEHPAKFLPGKR